MFFDSSRGLLIVNVYFMDLFARKGLTGVIRKGRLRKIPIPKSKLTSQVGPKKKWDLDSGVADPRLRGTQNDGSVRARCQIRVGRGKGNAGFCVRALFYFRQLSLCY